LVIRCQHGTVIFRAIATTATWNDRGGDLVVRGPAIHIREVLDAAGLASVVDEVETTEVETTHD
jgi:hypothetical protein